MSASDSVLETLDEIVTALQADATVSASFTKIGKIVSPKLIPPFGQTELPAICLAPVNSPEAWVTTQKREVRHAIEVYVIGESFTQETDMRENLTRIKQVADALRGSRLTNYYLNKPIQIDSINYDTTPYGEDGSWTFVGTILLDCRRLFIGT